MAFVVKNDGFICEFCGAENTPAPRTCRNHCVSCLCSKHVDDDFPGDRSSQCGGKMIPKQVKVHPKHEWVILHECDTCHKQITNKVADDDSRETMAMVMKKASV